LAVRIATQDFQDQEAISILQHPNTRVAIYPYTSFQFVSATVGLDDHTIVEIFDVAQLSCDSNTSHTNSVVHGKRVGVLDQIYNLCHNVHNCCRYFQMLQNIVSVRSAKIVKRNRVKNVPFQ
jgi:hypothetical protein